MKAPSKEQLTLPSGVAIAVLRKCVADASLAEEQLLVELRLVRKFTRDARLALKVAEGHARSKTITFTPRGRK